MIYILMLRCKDISQLTSLLRVYKTSSNQINTIFAAFVLSEKTQIYFFSDDVRVEDTSHVRLFWLYLQQREIHIPFFKDEKKLISFESRYALNREMPKYDVSITFVTEKISLNTASD